MSKNKKNIKNFLTKCSVFTAEENPCILHGQVFVMYKFLLQEANVYYEWKLSPAVTDVKEINNRLIIVENTLRADQGYTVYLKGEALSQSEPD